MQRNRNAVLSLPLFLLIGLLLSAAVIGMITLSVYQRYKDAEIQLITQKVYTIVVEAEAMYAYAHEGSLKQIRVSFPSSLRCIVFGGLPDETGGFSQERILDEQTSNNYYLVMNDGTTKIFYSTARFSDTTFQQSVVLYPGSYDIVLELQSYGGTSYVTISQK